MKRIIILILIVIILGALAVFFGINYVAKSAIETVGENVLGVPVTVDSLSLSFTKGEATIDSVTVANPVGYRRPEAVSLNEIYVTLDTKSIFSGDTLIIHELRVTEPRVAVDFLGNGRMNLAEIRQNLDQYRSGANNAETDNDVDRKSRRTVQIDLLQIDSATASVTSPLNSTPRDVTLRPIILTDIGAGQTAAQIDHVITMVMTQITQQAASQNLNTVSDEVINQLKERAEDQWDGQTGIFQKMLGR